jgi:hypothetical protein
MNHQDKQLTSFLGMTIGSALDDYMANLAQQIAKSNKQEETSKRNVKELEAVLATYQQRLPIVEQKIAAVENKLWLAQQEKNKLEQQVKERDKKINDLEIQLRQKDNELAVVRKKLEKTEADLALANKSNREMKEREKQHSELIQDASDAVREGQKALEYIRELLDSATTKIKDMEDGVSKLLSKVTIPSTMIKFLNIGTQHCGRIEEWGCREGGLIRPNHYDVVKVNSDWLGWSINGFIMSKLYNKEGDSVHDGWPIAKYVNLD